MSGTNSAVTANPTVAMAILAREKLRSLKRFSGSSGSFRLTACHHRNRPMTTTPAPIPDQTQAFQWYELPS